MPDNPYSLEEVLNENFKPMNNHLKVATKFAPKSPQTQIQTTLQRHSINQNSQENLHGKTSYFFPSAATKFTPKSPQNQIKTTLQRHSISQNSQENLQRKKNSSVSSSNSYKKVFLDYYNNVLKKLGLGKQQNNYIANNYIAKVIITNRSQKKAKYQTVGYDNSLHKMVYRPQIILDKNYKITHQLTSKDIYGKKRMLQIKHQNKTSWWKIPKQQPLKLSFYSTTNNHKNTVLGFDRLGFKESSTIYFGVNSESAKKEFRYLNNRKSGKLYGIKNENFNRKSRSNDRYQKSLESIFHQAEQGKIYIERLVLSGHHDPNHKRGVLYSSGADKTQINIITLFAKIAKSYPKAILQVEDIMFSACNSDMLNQLKNIFPKLKTVWSYEGYSPTVDTGAKKHIETWERKTRKSNIPNKLHQQEKKYLKRTSEKNIIIWSYQSGRWKQKKLYQ